MERGKDGNYRITRDEQRLFKVSAAIANHLELTKIYAHYLGVRQLSRTKSAKVRIYRPEPALEKELQMLPALVEFDNDNQAIEGMKYVYTPHLAEESVGMIRSLAGSHYLHEGERAEIATVVEQYDAINQEPHLLRA